MIGAWVSCVASCGYQARKICLQLVSGMIEAAEVGLQQPLCLIGQFCEVHFDIEEEKLALDEEFSPESLYEVVFY